MKTVGIVGGLGRESTIDYYRPIIAEYRKRAGEGGYPHILIDSLDVDKGLRLVSTNQLSELADYLVEATRRLAAAGADFAFMAANSPHIVFDDARQRSPVPLISIVEAACAEVQRRGFTTVGLLGTGFTMRGRFYPEVFSKRGIAIETPSPEEQNFIHEIYLNELLIGVFKPETRERLQQTIANLVHRHHVEAVLLAGPELPLILRADSIAGASLLGTTQIHVSAAVSEILHE